MIQSTGNNSEAPRTLPTQCADIGFRSKSRTDKPKVFIPITDELLFDYPELITSPLMPYQVDHPCFHWLSIEIEEVDNDELEQPCKDAA